MNKSYFFSFILLLIIKISFAQNRKTDSLYSIYKNTSKHDTIRLRTLQDMGWTFVKKDPDSAIKLTTILLEETQRKSYRKQEGAAKSNLGVFYKNKGDYGAALKYMKEGLAIRQEIKDLKGTAVSYNGLGNLYIKMADFSKAIDCFLENIKIYESLGEMEPLASSFNNIGNAYFKLENYNNALKYYNQSFLLKLKYGKPEDVASSYLNISSTYFKLHKTDSAAIFVNKAIDLYKKEDSYFDLSLCYGNIGDVFFEKKAFDSSLKYFEQSLHYAKLAKSSPQESTILANMAQAFLSKNNIQKAEECGLKSLKLAEEVNESALKMDTYALLYEVYKAKSDFKTALKYYEKFIFEKNNLYSEQNQKVILQKTIEYDYQKRTLADSLASSEEKKLSEIKLKQEKTFRLGLYAGLLLIALFAAFMFNRYRVTQKQKLIIEAKEKETHTQKLIIEEKQTEILDSMSYAKRIQRSLMATEKNLKDKFTEHFVLFKPKDIVSGDFYWAATIIQNGLKAQKEYELNNLEQSLNDSNSLSKMELFYIAVCDSTGHGVPGAMMSMLNMGCLNEAVKERKLIQPNEILNHTRSKIIQSLAEDGSNDGGKDGMDCVLCCFDLKNRKLTYSAANNSFYIIRNNELIHMEADKMPVGKSPKEDISFSLREFQLQKGDTVYLFTDGYADQFGGDKGKKFKYKQLEELLVSINGLSFVEKSNQLESTFRKWRGKLEQVDDVCIIGLKI